VPNVAKVMRLLRRGGFVRSTRGQSGGYSLARPIEETVVGDVLAGLGPRLFDAQFCERYSGNDALCTHLGDCSILPVLRRLQDAVDAVMGRLTLGQLLRGEADVPVRGAHAVGLPVIDLGRGATRV
jgi:Rrf2 family iron-sulfur cluster assembly transcriptional regulator